MLIIYQIQFIYLLQYFIHYFNLILNFIQNLAYYYYLIVIINMIIIISIKVIISSIPNFDYRMYQMNYQLNLNYINSIVLI